MSQLQLPSTTRTYYNAKGQKITEILPSKCPTYNVAVYCRVSTEHEAQQHSLTAQIDYFRKMVATKTGWTLVGEYVESKSGRDIDARKEFKRMLEDCRAGKIDIVVTKSVSRFGRNVVDTLNVLRELRGRGIDVYFENEEIHSISEDSEFYLTLLACYAEAENTSRSENIKWGIRNQAENNPYAPIYARPCFGYRKDGHDGLEIVSEEAEIIRLIFKLYLSGFSIHGIRKELNKRQIKTPTGKTVWSKRTLEHILTNEKYIGTAMVYKTYCGDYLHKRRITNRGELRKCYVPEHHPAIISKEDFEKVQAEIQRRSNIVRLKDGSVKRKTSHYSMKTKETRR